MPILGVNHVTLNVRDLERARKFYELLGFQQSGHRDGKHRMLFFTAGGHHHHIALMEVGPDAPPPERLGVGAHHVALTVDRETELTRLHGLVAEAGYRVVQIIDHRTNRSFYVLDPDGNMLEITYDAPREEWDGVTANPFQDDLPYELPAGKD